MGPRLAAGAVLLALHVASFGDWIVDDAGISFAYAQNLATGHGLVAQPGAAPVEGYSNPLWVLLLAPTFALGLFDVVWTPKVLAVLLVLGGMAALARSAVPALGRAPVAVGLLLLAAQPAFAIWVMRRLPWRAAAVVAGLWLAWSFAQRSLAFRREPTLSIQRVRAEWLEPAQRLAGIVGPSLRSILLPDVGAMVLWGQLRVHDFGGLVDREFAHARDAGALRDLVLARRADLVVLHGPWAERARMEADPRFAELYEVVAAFPPPTPGCAPGSGCAAGIWVRRAQVSDPEMLARLRGAL